MLIPDWRETARKAWSARLIALAFTLEAADYVLPVFADYVPRWVTLLVTLLALAARFWKQSNMRGPEHE